MYILRQDGHSVFLDKVRCSSHTFNIRYVYDILFKINEFVLHSIKLFKCSGHQTILV